MVLWVLRAVFMAIAFGAGISIVTQNTEDPGGLFTGITLIIAAAGIVSFDILIRKKPIEVISCGYFGIVVGLFLTYIVGVAVDPILTFSKVEDVEHTRGMLNLLLAIPLCYICTSFLLQTRNDFRFIIPYVEFSKDIKGNKPLILDTSVVIDGRIADLVGTNIIDSQLVMPKFVLAELQNIADSSDKMRRTRGRRGLDILKQLQSNADVDLLIDERESEEMKDQPVDSKLVLLAKKLNGKVVTGDYNLNKIATLQEVPVINLNEIMNALRPVFLPGEEFQVKIVKEGEGDSQGVGYLDDGTMIVIEGGRNYLQEMAIVSVTSVLQTSAGRMIFANFEGVS
ncbi:MAG: PIN/TRAM domain-containing protein [Planctomycetaceae bacterium]|nr:PIN/TRAM domain-containing protein [Planctomycetaceae bacterium]|tara:strand:+ start:968 stop:1987 length:1020 start_codon:yes stop_codon:yes gene_type:complete